MSLPEHILMTADTVGGVWTYSIELARELRCRGVRISLATMGAPLSPDQWRESAEAGVDIYESDFRLEWMEQPWRDVDSAGEWLLALEAKLRPDLIHLNNYAHGNLRWHAPVVIVGHSCVCSWWNAVHGEEPPAEWAEYRRRVRNGLRAADMVVGVSRAMLRELQRWYGVSSGSVVYNGHRTSGYGPAEKQDFVLSIGRLWDAAKNVSTLDSAASMLGWPTFVAGETQHPEGGQRGVQSVHPIGRLSRDEIKPWFAHAGIYALPALYEPFGLSVLEAALSGCALVLGDIPTLREIWGEAALYVSPRDHEALALAVNALIARPAAREELSERAQARALGFTLDSMVQGYARVYRQARTRYGGAKQLRASCVS